MSVTVNLQKARENMVEQQIRPWEVLDQRVLDLMERMPRDAFVPDEYRALAYADIEIPIGEGQRMMAPRIEARALQALQITPGERVLEVGTGSGWLTALLARLGAEVYSCEIRPALLERARERLAAQGIENVTLEARDGAGGWQVHAPYDAIVLTGSVPEVGEDLRRQLAAGGRLFAVVGEAPAMEAVLVRRAGDEEWIEESLFETVLARLDGVEREPTFEL